MNANISILMYHQIGQFGSVPTHKSTYCHHKSFARQMLSLRLLGFSVISLDQALLILNGQSNPKKRSVVLTFDDGYHNFYDYAYPNLKQFGFNAIVYLIANYIGRPAEWFAKEGRNTPYLLSKETILSLQKQGISFGSHGLTHVKLAKVQKNVYKKEIESSKTILQELLGHEVSHFCYPYGSYSSEVAKAVKKAGYRSAVTCLRAAATPEFSFFELPRKAVSYGDSLLGFWWKLLIKNRPKSGPIISV